ncbi:ferrochelatase [bacterium K02(2017)]|nr:ferrochelatase [bacterium K02(2017)]
MSKSVKTAIILGQLGTPDEATLPAVKRFLKEFFNDPRVIDTNSALRFLIVNGYILPFRSPKSTKLYERFFKNHGPSLRTFSESLTKKLNHQYKDNKNIIIDYGMRYGNPNLDKVFSNLALQQQCQNFLIVPLFPQFSYATTASIYDVILDACKNCHHFPNMRFMAPFFDKPEFVQPNAQIINKAIKERASPPDRLVFSYHGLPQRNVDNGDPYYDMCNQTTKLICQQLDYPIKNIIQTFQSRVGRKEWLKPYTDVVVAELGQQGIKDIMVTCPSFTMDCLETYDEIGLELNHLFKENGGDNLELIECLNDREIWVDNLSRLIDQELIHF